MQSLGGAQFSEAEAKNLSPLTLAYIGDAVFELFVREALLAERNAPAGALHKRATKIVCAKAQSGLMRRLLAENLLSEEEIEIFKRGRNAKPNAPPKNANLADYAYATGFEALTGYLYLTKSPRLAEIFSYVNLT
jgi:ribonuclease-3 family protein